MNNKVVSVPESSHNTGSIVIVTPKGKDYIYEGVPYV
jgi:hypothetical protein